MPGFQAKLRKKQYIPQYKINLFDIGMNVLGRLVMMGIQGGIVALLCHVGLGISRSIFGQVLIPGLLQMPGNMLAAVLPSSFAAFAPFLVFAIPLGLTALAFIYSMSNDFGKPPSVQLGGADEDNEILLSFAISWLLPMGLFAYGLNAGFGLTAASLFTAGVAALGSAYWTLVKPTKKDIELLLVQKQLIAEALSEQAQELNPLQPVPNPEQNPEVLPKTTVEPSQPQTPTSVDTPTQTSASSHALTPLFSTQQNQVRHPGALRWNHAPSVRITRSDNPDNLPPSSPPSPPRLK